MLLLIIDVYNNFTADVEQYHCRADSKLAPRQWETSLHSKAVSNWLDARVLSEE